MVVDDFKDGAGKWRKGVQDDVRWRTTKSCEVWYSMRQRCTSSAVHRKRPTYVGCTMSSMFKDFQTFTDWHVQQVGYDQVEYQLDKDILVSGNKIYSECVCVLVPRELNQFLTSCTASRGEYPQGVHWNKRDEKFVAQINIGGKRKHIGYYPSDTSAAAAYKTAKEAEAFRWYERLKAGEFAVDPRVIERMRTWTLE